MRFAIKAVGAAALALVAGVAGMEWAGWPGVAPWLATRADRGCSSTVTPGCICCWTHAFRRLAWP